MDMCSSGVQTVFNGEQASLGFWIIRQSADPPGQGVQGTSMIIALPKTNVIVVTVVGVVSVVVTIINVCVVAVVAVVVGVAASIINLVTSVTPETEKHYGTRGENCNFECQHCKTSARRALL